MIYLQTVDPLGERRDGRVDDGNGLENRSGCKLTGGSNPSPSATNLSGLINIFRGDARVDDWDRLLSG